ncbi:hypothetical protein RUND412_004032 [Rhizina undulata]
MTDEFFTKLRERIKELRERLRPQMNEGKFEDFKTNSTVPAAAPASGRPKAPSEISVSDAIGSEKFATAPQSPTQSSGDDDQRSEEEDSLYFDINPELWFDRTLQRTIEQQEKRLKACESF